LSRGEKRTKKDQEERRSKRRGFPAGSGEKLRMEKRGKVLKKENERCKRWGGDETFITKSEHSEENQKGGGGGKDPNHYQENEREFKGSWGCKFIEKPEKATKETAIRKSGRVIFVSGRKRPAGIQGGRSD